MNIPFHRARITPDEIDAVNEVLRSGWITMGRATLAFEERFAAAVGAPHAIAVSSCTAALHLALVVLGVGPGDEVIVPADTFVATAEAVEYCGARPVLADIDRDTHCVDPAALERAITPRTRAVIPVHFAGQPCDMAAIMDIAQRHGARVVDDAAHAFPASIGGAAIGSCADLTCFSFYATKTLTTGEGGMITTRNPEWADALATLRLHGMSRDAWRRYSGETSWRYDVTRLGYKYNTTDIAAAIGLGQLARADALRDERERIAQRYSRAFAADAALIPYAVRPGGVCAWHLYPLKLNLDSLAVDRDRFMALMRERGVATSVHFIPLYHFTHFKGRGWSPDGFPESEWVFAREVSLPLYPGMTDAEVDYVIDAVLGIARANRR